MAVMLAGRDTEDPDADHGKEHGAGRRTRTPRPGRQSATNTLRNRGGSSVGQSSGLIIRRSQVQVLPAPQIYLWN
jgi:hypothetical protein